MDQEDQKDPKNYSAALGWMILAFVLIFIIAVVLLAVG
jgi:hypothetical protein